MDKFDKIFSRYLVSEGGETITINTDQIQDAAKKMAADPAMQKMAPIFGAQANALDTDKIHQGFVSIIDPKNPSKFSEVFKNPSDQKAALDHLMSQGIPIGNVNQNANQNQQQKPTPPTPTNTEKSPTSYGGNLQGV